MKIGLYFGSFNPIHIGHMALANYMVEYSDIDKLWFVVSSQNPFKHKDSLLADHHRYYMVQMAVENDARFKAVNIEFNMPCPSYTIDTLTYIKEKYPQHQFSIIMGADGLPTFHKWKNYHEIIKSHQRLVYPRKGFESIDIAEHPNTLMVNAPSIEISASFIREAIQAKKDIRHFLPPGIYDYIAGMNFYKK